MIELYLLSVNLHIYCSQACAINLGSSVILTGGRNSLTTVSEYNEAGYVKNLPPLLQGRYAHGCSFYDNEEGTKVGTKIKYTIL